MKRLVFFFFCHLCAGFMLSAQTDTSLLRAASAYEKGNFDEALSAVNNTLQRNPKNDDALTLRARILIIQKKTIAAAADASVLLARNPGNTYALNVMGMVKMERKDYQGALNDFNKTIAIDPGFYRAYGNRARAKTQLKYKAADILSDYDVYLKVIEDVTIMEEAGNYCLQNNSVYHSCSSYFTRSAELRKQTALKAKLGYKTEGEKKYMDMTLTAFEKSAQLSNQDYERYKALENFRYYLANLVGGQAGAPAKKLIEDRKKTIYNSLIVNNNKNVCARYFLLQNSSYFTNNNEWDALINQYDGNNGAVCASEAALWIGRELAKGDSNRGIQKNPVKAREYYDLALKFNPKNKEVKSWITQLR